MPGDAETTHRQALTPPLVIEADQYHKLLRLAFAASDTMPDVSDYLARELERAQIVPAGASEEGRVVMGSEVSFRDESNGRVQSVVLVYPPEADIEKRRISVLTPIGAALLGLACGQTITFHTRSGERRELTILSAIRGVAGRTSDKADG